MSHGVIRGPKRSGMRAPRHAGASPFGADFHLVILGQSNARGQGSGVSADNGLDLLSNYSPVTMAAKLGVANTDPIVYDFTLVSVPLQPYQAAGVNFGYELALGRYLYRTAGASSPYVSKMSVNGQDIETMLPGAGTPTNPKEMWLQLTEYLDGQVARAGRKIDAVVWSQWEANATSDAKANAYSGNLDTLFTALRARYGNFRVFMVRANPNVTGGGVLASSRTIIRTTQTTWCGVGGNNALLIDTDDCSLQTDNIHYSEDSYVVIGNRLGEAIAAWNKPTRNPNIGTGPAPWIQGVEMPTVGNQTDGGAVTPFLPVHKAGDVLVVAVEHSVDTVAPTLTVANGFAQLGSTIIGNSSVGVSIYTKTAASSSELPPTITAAATTERIMAVAFSVRGSSGVDATATTGGSLSPFSLNGPTTTVNNALVIYVLGVHAGSTTADVLTFVNAGLAGFSEFRTSREVLDASGQIISLGVGVKDTAGAVAQASGTFNVSPSWASIAVAFKP